jgi:hypothetical protein
VFRGRSGRALPTHTIRPFTLHFPSRASPCAIRFRTDTAANTKNKLHLRRGALLSGRNVLMFRKNTIPVSAVKMLVARSSKMAVHLYQTTQPYFPRDILRSYFGSWQLIHQNKSLDMTCAFLVLQFGAVFKISLLSQLHCCCRRRVQ